MSEGHSLPRKESPGELKPGLSRRDSRSSAHQDMRTSIVEILSNTANGCLNELGYEPAMVQQLQKAHDAIKHLQQRNDYLQLAVQQYEMNCKHLQERADYVFEDNVTLNSLVRTTQQELAFIRSQVVVSNPDVKRLHAENSRLADTLKKTIREAGHYKSLLLSHGIQANAVPPTPVNASAPQRNAKQSVSHIPGQSLPAPLPPRATQGLTLNTESVPRIYHNMLTIQTPVNLTPASPFASTPVRGSLPNQTQQHMQHAQMQNRAMQQMYPQQRPAMVLPYPYPPAAESKPQVGELQANAALHATTRPSTPNPPRNPGSKRNSLDAAIGLDDESRKRVRMQEPIPPSTAAAAAPEVVMASHPSAEEGDDDEEEDEEEVDENGLRTIASCIEMAMDYDEETEMLTCRFCDDRKQQGLQDTVAVFQGASEQDLHQHLEHNHPEAFLELRQSTLKSEHAS